MTPISTRVEVMNERKLDGFVHNQFRWVEK
jgi:hypothetical protein